jgi:hypothetical protein
MNDKQRRLLYAQLVRKGMKKYPSLPIRSIKIMASDDLENEGAKPVKRYSRKRVC